MNFPLKRRHLFEDATTRHDLIKSMKAKMDRQRSWSQRFADRTTKRLGTSTFLFLNCIWFTVWLLINTNLIPGITPFDPYPFGLLTTTVSLEAIVLAILVLISQNRAAKVADVREEVDLQVNIISEKEITKIIELLKKLLEAQGIDMSKDRELKSMLKTTNTERLERAIDKELE